MWGVLPCNECKYGYTHTDRLHDSIEECPSCGKDFCSGHIDPAKHRCRGGKKRAMSSKKAGELLTEAVTG